MTLHSRSNAATMNRLTNGNSTQPASDKAKEWQLEILMEKLRSKASQYKTLPEISKSVRMAMLDKRYALDSVEKSLHQKCLDTLQHSIKVTSLQSMKERLESLTRQLGLKFGIGLNSELELFISSDMFYLEIILDSNGGVLDVKVHHEDQEEQQSCLELVSCLSRGDFSDFTAQLEGLASIYQLNAEKKIKCKAFIALQSLESDLSTLAQLQSFMKEPFNLLYKSPVGILEQRKGGHPMKLTYFVSPYELINVDRYDIDPISTEAIVAKNLGYSVTVCIEGSASHKLQTSTLITIVPNISGKNSPQFSPLNNQNSAAIPACFVLKLNKPMPMCVAAVRQIQQVTELENIEQSQTHPLLSLIVNHASEGLLESRNNKGLFVTLPDQNHCYFMTENKNMDGVLVSSIPFTHPAHVSQILVILRQQALFNTIIGSCVRPNSKQDFENMTMFEISALSWNYISLTLEHPLLESMATAEIDLTDIANLICRISSPGTPPPSNAPPDSISETSTKIINRSFSIPVTMRTVIKMWEKQSTQRRNHYGENFSLPLGSGDPGGSSSNSSSNKNSNSGNSLTEFGGLDDIKQEPPDHGAVNNNTMTLHHPSQSQHNMYESMNDTFHNFNSETILSNIELTNILSGGQSEKPRRTKRRSEDVPWKNKRKPDDCDLMETSSSDSTSRSTPILQDGAEILTPNSALGFHSDLELSGLDPAELLGDKEPSDFAANLDDLTDMDVDLLAGPSRRKSRDQKSPNSMMLELGDKNLVPPSVSITPIVANFASAQGGNAEKRPGIEIIPLATSATTILPSSITITPIASSQKGDEKNRERKSSKSKSDERSRLEKKRKRKRDESPMGPPDKVPHKQDPLSKPVTVSIKATESPPPSPNMMRKFNASPTQNRSMLTGKLSPNLVKTTLKTAQSPKQHSPAHVSSSPKHAIVGISSPKSLGTSPKHPSTSSGSGKPSMSTLKNAANSPSGKSNSDSKKLKDGSQRDKEKKPAGVFQPGNKPKSTPKIKPLDLNSDGIGATLSDGLPSPSGSNDLSKSSPNQVRNRKGSLSAIVDKLKSAQHCDGLADLLPKSATSANVNAGSKDRTGGQLTGKTNAEKLKPQTETTKNSEYMVKPSSDGMKITINKTRTKDTKNVSKSGTGSPKIHTGLKPGVNSGPASKKPQHSAPKSSGSPNFLKSSSSKIGSPGVKVPSAKPKTGNDLIVRNKDRPKVNKSTAEKSIFTLKDGRKSSPTPMNRDESDLYKMNLVMENQMQFVKNFQIPKLSARTTTTTPTPNPSTSVPSIAEEKRAKPIENNVNNRNIETKIYDLMTKTDVQLPKFPLQIPPSNPGKMFENPALDIKRNNVVKPESGEKKENVTAQNLTQKDDPNYKINYPVATVCKNFINPVVTSESASILGKSIDLTSKFVAPPPPLKDTDKKEPLALNKTVESASSSSANDVLLDFSQKSEKIAAVFPQSPTASIGPLAVKSPSPQLVEPSPLSASPCITDDELMDEAVIGLGK